MMRFTTGNLLDSEVDALVNTVNTVGVMGRGIAMMFRDKFPENHRLYQEACAAGEIAPGGIFVTEQSDMFGPRWIVNFATKQHWRNPSKIEWVRTGLSELRSFIEREGVRSIALPPLGAGNGGLDWSAVRPVIEEELSDMADVEVVVYEPTSQYQNVAKRAGVEALTPARALIAEIVRRYAVLGIDCTMLEVQKLAYFIGQAITRTGLKDPLRLRFVAHRYGPYADSLRHMLNGLDGSYLQCDKRIADAGAFDVIRFQDDRRDKLNAYFTTQEARPYRHALEGTAALIDGFESPLGMELLATVDWVLNEGVEPTVPAILEAVRHWPGGAGSAERKTRIFDERLVGLALHRLQSVKLASA